MDDSGLEEILELVYADNAVTHMLTEKAISRAVRGYLLVDAALNVLLLSKVFGITLPSSDNKQEEIISEEVPRLEDYNAHYLFIFLTIFQGICVYSLRSMLH